MTRLFLCLATALSLLSAPLRADPTPVVVELYTSQGCSSCPPADAFLHELAARPDVIALALHVDYWDYIGWKDSFANASWSDRQRRYASGAGRSMVYTPQMIINGTDHVVGNRPKDVDMLIKMHRAKTLPVQLTAIRKGNSVQITSDGGRAGKGPFLVQLIRFKPLEEVRITRGENAGHTLSYANIVTDIDVVTSWNGRSTLDVSAPMRGGKAGVIIVQRKGIGPIVAAAKVQ